MDDRRSGLVDDDPHLEERSRRRRPDEHRDGRVVGLERLEVVSECVQHVLVADTVLAGAGFDVHYGRLSTARLTVKIC